jgi:hypothetical protein
MTDKEDSPAKCRLATISIKMFLSLSFVDAKSGPFAQSIPSLSSASGQITNRQSLQFDSTSEVIQSENNCGVPRESQVRSLSKQECCVCIPSVPDGNSKNDVQEIFYEGVYTHSCFGRILDRKQRTGWPVPQAEQRLCC